MEQFESAHAVHSGVDPTIRIPVDPKSIQFAGELRPSWQIYPRAISPRDGSQRLNRWLGMQKRCLPAMPANGRLMQTWLQLSCLGFSKAADALLTSRRGGSWWIIVAAFLVGVFAGNGPFVLFLANPARRHDRHAVTAVAQRPDL